MSIHKLLKNVTVCGASLMMMASLGAGIGNVSARRVHHYRPRTHRVAISSHTLYKQGRKDGADYVDACEGGPNSKIKRLTKKYINRLIAYHFNKSYVKGFNPKLPSYAGMSLNAAWETERNLISKARKVARQRTHKPVNVKRQAIKKHVRKNVNRNKHARKAKRATVKKHYARNHNKVNHVNKPTTVSSVNTPSDTTSKNTDFVDILGAGDADPTDGGKYYNWNQLRDLLNGASYDAASLRGDFASDALENRIRNSINYGLQNNLYNSQQLKDIWNNSEIYNLGDNICAAAEAKYDMYHMR